jgi:hypothetical protein
MKYRFYVREIPEPWAIWDYIRTQTDIEHYQATMKPAVDASNLLTLKHSFDIPELIRSVDEMQNRYGFKGWQSQAGDSKSYGGLSLVYNPDYVEDVDLNQQTLGTSVNRIDEFFWSRIERFKSIKNTYFDSYAFRHDAPCVEETSINSFIKSFKRHRVRSRLATINSKYVSKQMQSSYGWHKDELVFENLRINIPIKTDDTFMFQIVNKEPVHLSVGNMYSWDTNIAHRVFPTSEDDRARTHLVLGFSPWFDYDAEEDCFFSNEFYGQMHPIDMLINGHIHEKIKGLL